MTNKKSIYASTSLKCHKIVQKKINRYLNKYLKNVTYKLKTKFDVLLDYRTQIEKQKVRKNSD